MRFRSLVVQPRPDQVFGTDCRCLPCSRPRRETRERCTSAPARRSRQSRPRPGATRARCDMERRLAFAWSSAVVGVAVSGVITVAAVTGSPFLGFGPDEAPTRDRASTSASARADEYVIIHRPGSPPTGEHSGGDGTSPTDTVASRRGASAAVAPTPVPASRSATANPSTPVATAPSPAPTSPPPTTASPPTTTASPPTTVPGQVLYVGDLPPGWEVPSGWPADKPLPPVPPGCVLGHLEDNLKWNCQH